MQNDLDNTDYIVEKDMLGRTVLRRYYGNFEFIVTLLVIVFLILFLCILPLCFAILGFWQRKRDERLMFGVLSVLALGYFFLDVNFNWIIGHLFGSYGSDQFRYGLVESKGLFNTILGVNILGALMGIFLIYQFRSYKDAPTLPDKTLQEPEDKKRSPEISWMYKPKQAQPDIRTLDEKILVGQKAIMSLANNTTSELWGGFIPRVKEILNPVGADRYSINLYDPRYFDAYNPAKKFTKWAAVEVKEAGMLPEAMENFILPGGLYAVFPYQGSSSDNRIFQYIFSVWLPASDYVLDNRPHFEVLGEKYKNNQQDSEEAIWVPVKKKEL